MAAGSVFVLMAIVTRVGSIDTQAAIEEKALAQAYFFRSERVIVRNVNGPQRRGGLRQRWKLGLLRESRCCILNGWGCIDVLLGCFVLLGAGTEH
jgi:hypothetical protein